MSDQVVAIIVIISFIYRVICAVVCSDEAEKLNRSTEGWAFFAFILPTIALIWIPFMKPKTIWDDDKN